MLLFLRLFAAMAIALALGLAIPQAGLTQVASQAKKVTLDSQWPVDSTGKGCASPTWRTDIPRDDARRVLIIGDSLTRESRQGLEKALQEKGWIPTVRCWGGKGTAWGVEQIQRARQLRQLPPTVVVALGTNDVWWLGVSMSDGVDSVMSALGAKRKVYWVNLRFGPNNYSDLPHHGPANRTLNKKAREYENLTVVNFAREYAISMKEDPKVGWADGVHLNPTGYAVRSKIIGRALGKPDVFS